MHAILLDTKTGIAMTTEGWTNTEFSPSWWAEGNGSCDCNRELVFGNESEHENNICHGGKRYLLVGAYGEMEGWTIAEVIEMANEEYPIELRNKHGIP